MAENLAVKWPQAAIQHLYLYFQRIGRLRRNFSVDLSKINAFVLLRFTEEFDIRGLRQ